MWNSSHQEEGDFWPPVGPVYASLTASTTLRGLLLLCNTDRQDYMSVRPKSTWTYMLPHRRMLPHLTSLSACVDGDAFNQLVCCCPNLQDLDMVGVYIGCQPGDIVNLPKLEQLTVSCSSLAKLKFAVPDRSALDVIAQTTGLQDLQLAMFFDPPTLSGRPELLTAPKQLTNLRCYGR